jgi:hypothetical protein
MAISLAALLVGLWLGERVDEGTFLSFLPFWVGFLGLFGVLVFGLGTFMKGLTILCLVLKGWKRTVAQIGVSLGLPIALAYVLLADSETDLVTSVRLALECTSSANVGQSGLRFKRHFMSQLTWLIVH